MAPMYKVTATKNTARKATFRGPELKLMRIGRLLGSLCVAVFGASLLIVVGILTPVIIVIIVG